MLSGSRSIALSKSYDASLLPGIITYANNPFNMDFMVTTCDDALTSEKIREHILCFAWTSERCRLRFPGWDRDTPCPYRIRKESRVSHRTCSRPHPCR